MSQVEKRHRTVTRGLIALGGNLESHIGSPAETIEAAITAFTRYSIEIERQSQVYRTPAFPAGSGPDYANACVEVRFAGTAKALLNALQEIESEFARDRKARWASRTLDLDLLGFGDAVLPDAAGFAYWAGLPLDAQKQCQPDDLIVPHPRIQDRAFVLVPLAEIAADWVHPVFGVSVAELRDRLDAGDLAAVKPWS